MHTTKFSAAKFSPAKLALAALFIALAPAAAAQAHEASYYAALSGPAEAPANTSPGTGLAFFDVDLDLHTLHISLTFKDLLGNTSASHIHAPNAATAATTIPFAGTNGVATTTPTFAGFPLGVKAGSYDITLDLTSATSYNPAFITSFGGSIGNAEASLFNSFDTGKAYLNIHTASFPGGEIRGFLLPIPEPSAALLLATPLPLLTRRRRHA